MAGQGKAAKKAKEGRRAKTAAAGRAEKKVKAERVGGKTAPKMTEKKKTKAPKKAAKKSVKAEEARKQKEKRKKVKRKKGPAETKLEKAKRMIKAKPRPRFRGRFGKRSIRRKAKAKWMRWRMPRGIDIKRRREHGLVPGTGYRTPKGIRFLHPSGLKQVLVHNVNELHALESGALAVAGAAGMAVVIASKVGGRKRAAIVGAAKEKGIKVVNA